MHGRTARISALAGTVCISFTGIFVALADVTPVTAAFFRAAYAIPLLAVLWVVWRRRDRRPARLRVGGAAAGVFLAVDLVLWHRSIELIGAGLATVVANIQVVFVGLFSFLLYRQRPTRRTVVCGGVAFAGLILISGLGRDDAFGVDPALGTILGLGSAVCYAVFIIGFQRSNPGGIAPAPLALLDATIGTALATAVIGTVGGGLDLDVSWPAQGWLIALAVVGQVVGWTLIAYALPRLPAISVSVLILAQPMLSVLWGRLFLDETLSAVQAAGVVVVLAAMVAVNLQPSLVADARAREGAGEEAPTVRPAD
ncbi:MAG TPA: DMT family transporter [Acidimicrobiia bacterium]